MSHPAYSQHLPETRRQISSWRCLCGEGGAEVWGQCLGEERVTPEIQEALRTLGSCGPQPWTTSSHQRESRPCETGRRGDLRNKAPEVSCRLIL